MTSGAKAQTAPKGASSVTLAGDVTGPSSANTVVKINGSPLGTTTGATTGYVLSWNGSAWVPAAATTSVTMGGDVTGNSATSTVAKINGTTLATLSGATSGQALAWNGTAWAPATISGGAPGTTVTSYFSGQSVNANTNYGLTSVSLTAGTWLINYFLGFGGSAGGQSCVYWLGTTNASQTNVICSNQVTTSSGFYTSGQGCSVYSYTVASTTTVYLNTRATAAGAILGNDNLGLTNLLTGIVAVRTA